MQTFDVVIAGGGMIGLAVACGLQGCGLRIAVLEKKMPNTFNFRGVYGLRVSAINKASERFLRYLEVWSMILRLRAKSYHGIEVWERDSFGYINFFHPKGGSHLGYIIENQVMQHALWYRAQKLDDITLFAPTQLKKVIFDENETLITMKDSNIIRARLLIGADGANSWLRKKTSIPLFFWDYDHHSLVANIRTEQPHQSIARQVFYGDGILAFLPLSDPHLCSIVWSLPPQEAARLRDIPAILFNSQLSVAFDMRLGRCQVESERKIFPLIARYARQFTSHRFVLVGDAAHTIHPLAGQGANLGFMNAANLVGEIRFLHQQGRDIGKHPNLRRYERNSKCNAIIMLASMQCFRELFDGKNLIKKLMRDTMLRMIDNLPIVKSFLLNKAIGRPNELPEWMQ